MRILVTGASGFIGQHIIGALRGRHELIACARTPAHLTTRFPEIGTTSMDFSRDLRVEDWLPLLQGVDVVVNTVGIIRESGSQTFEQLHHRAAAVLFRACLKAGVRKIVQISAAGADETACSQYHLTKKAADDYLKQLALDWVIVKPSLVYGRGGKSAAFFKALSVLPLVPVIGDGRQPVQPIHIDDLVAAVLSLIPLGAPSRLEIDAVGPAPVAFADMLMQYRNWLGVSSRRVFSVPCTLALAAGRVAGFLGATHMNTQAVQMLQRGSVGDASILKDRLQGLPRSLADALNAEPAEQADRWHARLYFLRPLLRCSIGLLWLVTGMLSLGVYPVQHSYALLSQVGISAELAPFVLYPAAAIDLALGAATLANFRIQLAGALQILLMVGYSAIISMGLGQLWTDPFGPVTKNVPLLAATLVMMALEKG